ncbi:CrcB family protein [Campylobacter sp. 19-13652]|uniref:fluoride efflux transporter FluC n=1 Tax=Campylobacter sp. 19-13652 TaxID=2840180 RepID=UPI001C7896D4|nr:CrcB family protein [Campylobacter sp. 19-13652]BCX78892.1 hypothetical protein LBC_03540 [Campylobacter sp. 19-13652]
MGAGVRYALSLVLSQQYVLVVNLIGSFLAGIAIVIIPNNNPQLKALIITGLLGGLTTFSSFSK